MQVWWLICSTGHSPREENARELATVLEDEEKLMVPEDDPWGSSSMPENPLSWLGERGMVFRAIVFFASGGTILTYGLDSPQPPAIPS